MGNQNIVKALLSLAAFCAGICHSLWNPCSRFFAIDGKLSLGSLRHPQERNLFDGRRKYKENPSFFRGGVFAFVSIL